MIHSPEGLARGLKIGSQELAKSLGSGLISSGASIVGSASKALAKGAAMAVRDEEYKKRREAKRLQSAASSGGVKAGIKAGAESVLSGFASGFAGLVSKPIQEGRKHGAMGFVRGIGIGMADAVLKPVLGVSDGIALAAQGVSNQYSDVLKVIHVRPPRAFGRAQVEFALRQLVPVDVRMAFAQKFVADMALKSGAADAFILAAFLDNGNSNEEIQIDESIIVSDRFVYKIDPSGKPQWSLSFNDISHCTLNADYSIGLITYRSSAALASASPVFQAANDTVLILPPANVAQEQVQERVLALYRALASNSSRMGSPSSVLDADVVSEMIRNSELKIDSTKYVDSALQSVCGYQFGSANNKNFPNTSLSSKEVLTRSTERLYLLKRSDDLGFFRSLDEHVRQLTHEWRINHVTLKASRCVATLIINNSSQALQIFKVDIKVRCIICILLSSSS